MMKSYNETMLIPRYILIRPPLELMKSMNGMSAEILLIVVVRVE